jgi:cerevisin
MRFFSTLTAFLTLSLASIVLAGPTPLKTVERFQGAETSGKYIVQFKKGVVRKNWLSKLSKGSKAASWDLINGIAGMSALIPHCDLRSLINRGMFSRSE